MSIEVKGPFFNFYNLFGKLVSRAQRLLLIYFFPLRNAIMRCYSVLNRMVHFSCLCLFVCLLVCLFIDMVSHYNLGLPETYCEVQDMTELLAISTSWVLALRVFPITSNLLLIVRCILNLIKHLTQVQRCMPMTAPAMGEGGTGRSPEHTSSWPTWATR